MLNISRLNFENIDEIEFVEAPKCECGNCNEDLLLVVPDGDDVGEYVANILVEFDCPSVAALVVGNDDVCKIFLPNHVVEGGVYDETFRCLKSDVGDEKKGKDEFLDIFIELVDNYSLHHLLILDEKKDEKDVYRIVYE